MFSALEKINYTKNNKIYRDLEYLNNEDSQRNVQDAQSSIDNSLLMVVENCQQKSKNDMYNQKNEFYDFQRGLCVIINQEKFAATANTKQVQ